MEYLKTTQVAIQLDVSPNTVLSWITTGIHIAGKNHRLDAQRIGRNFRITQDSVDRFLAETQPNRPTSCEACAPSALRLPARRETQSLERQLRKK